MLSGIASWVFGASEEEVAANNEIKLKTTVVEGDEWMLVDKDNGNSVLQECSNDTSPTHSVHSSSNSEDWLVTPPACFTAGQQEKLETSSMENLLIEHPSMSVYHTRGRPGSAGLDSDHDSQSSNDEETVEVGGPSRPILTATRSAPHRPHAVAQRAGLISQISKPMQRASQKVNRKNLSKNQLSRSNKVHEYSLRSGNLRRKQHSVNQPNKRKC